MSSDTPWQEEGRFFTSPWNHLEAAREGLDFPARVRFHDVSLRDGEQQWLRIAHAGDGERAGGD